MVYRGSRQTVINDENLRKFKNDLNASKIDFV